MAVIVYSLCALTAAACTWLLAQGYRRTHYRLLLWSAICFGGLTINNLILVLDKIALPEVDLIIWRLLTSFAAMSVLLYGLIWDAE